MTTYYYPKGTSTTLENFNTASSPNLFTSSILVITTANAIQSLVSTSSLYASHSVYSQFATQSLTASSVNTLNQNVTINGNIILQPSGTINKTIDFGLAYSQPALKLFNGGANADWGWGLQAGSMQLYAVTGDGTNNFCWNKGGTFNTTGTNELMRLTTSGSLGIGTTTPLATLDVNGNVYASQLTCSMATVFKFVNTGSAPLSSSIVAKWVNVDVGGVIYKMPLYL